MLLARYVADDSHECGCDEAGRGCLAGPVVAAAVILPPRFEHPLLNDSKQLSESRRYQLRSIIESEALAYAVAEVSPAEIDEINILQAAILAMHRAIVRLDLKPDRLLVDGPQFVPFHTTDISLLAQAQVKWREMSLTSENIDSYIDTSSSAAVTIDHHCIVEGDGRYMSIAAASILAKTYRDDLMHRLAADWPVYGWAQNKGYPTPAHRAAIELFGISPHHRQSFRLLAAKAN